MAEAGSKKVLMGLGIFLVAGAVVTSIPRLAGFGPSISDTAYSQGGEIGYWIGTAVGIVIGIVLVVQGLLAKDK
jgi:hypothetical protein